MLTTIAAKPTLHFRRVALWLLTMIVLLTASYSVVVALLPVPAPTLSQSIYSGLQQTGNEISLAWPNASQSAVGAVGYGVLASDGSDEPLPMASTAKVVAALAILKKHPLGLGETGPTITLTADDVTVYQQTVSIGGSAVRVTAGEELTQYQALQAMLIPSANNIAKSTAIWAFGSEAEYVAYANQMLADMGMAKTSVADASGLSAGSVSTARELVLLGEAALNNPVVNEIVAQAEVTLPVAGKVVTTNKVMGQAGIDGIKTGHTNASGGCFLFAATREVDGEQVRVIGAVMAAPSIDLARTSAPILIEDSSKGFDKVVALIAGQEVATLSVPWAQPAAIVAEGELSQIVWKGSELRLDVDVSSAGQQGKVGVAKLGEFEVNLMQEQSLTQPDYWWRFTHPVELWQAL